MNADTPSIAAPAAAPILLKKLRIAVDSTAFAVVSLAVATVAYLIFLELGEGAHGKWPDGGIIFASWLFLTVTWLGNLDDRRYSCRSSDPYSRFKGERLHSVALWWSNLKTSRQWHLACWPLLITLFWSSTTMQYSAPGSRGPTAGCGEYVVRVDGVTLSAETPSARALPWRHEWVPIRKKYIASTRVTSLDGTKFDATVMADLTLIHAPNRWQWQRSGQLRGYPKIDEALGVAAEAALAKTSSREIDRGTFALEIDTAAALNLADAGVRPDGEISISLKPYFDGSEAKVEAEKK